MLQTSISSNWEGRPYTGKELRPHFLLSEFGLKGSAMGAWLGPCQVQTSELVDWEDRLAADRIEAAQMLHFIGEFFGMSLREGVLFQRLWTAILADELASFSVRVERRGDDLFVAGRKLSVSIATASPISVLLHTGLNLDSQGATVDAIGLLEIGLEPRQVLALVDSVFERVRKEWESIDWACTKVRPVV